MKIEIPTFQNIKEEGQLIEITDAIIVMTEMTDTKFKVSKSWAEFIIEIEKKSEICYKLIFEIKNMKTLPNKPEIRKFSKVYLQRYEAGRIGYPIVYTSGAIKYKSGKYSKPITEFISHLNGDRNEII